jgi:hypothetical protein
MWISRAVFEDLRDQATKATAITDALRTHITALNTTLSWLQVRLTQLEHERAVMLDKYMGIKVTVPVFEPDQQSTGDILNTMPSFNDMGDAEADRLGIGWSTDGSLVYNRK